MNTLIHKFYGYGVHLSQCRIYIVNINNITHICFEDIDMGTSVTNASEQLATEIVEKFKLNPQKCKFYETYPPKFLDNDRIFDEIEYLWINNKAQNPKWKPSEMNNIFNFDD